MIYLPIDKILEQRRQPAAAVTGQAARTPAASAAAEASTATRDREDRRTREAR
jgi:ribosomal protein L12E/L44/L45/RPP1/RPP2